MRRMSLLQVPIQLGIYMSKLERKTYTHKEGGGSSHIKEFKTRQEETAVKPSKKTK